LADARQDNAATKAIPARVRAGEMLARKNMQVTPHDLVRIQLDVMLGRQEPQPN
jgi:hypothetical protein